MKALDEQIAALRESSGWLARPELRTLKVGGPDAERFLNGMLTNDTTKLMPMMAHRAIKATPKGKVEGVLRVRRTETSFLLDVLTCSVDRVRSSLSKLIITDDVLIEDESGSRLAYTILGPGAETLLLALGMNVAELFQHWCAEFPAAFVARDDWIGLPSFDVFVPRESADAFEKRLDERATKVSPESFDVLRVEHGAPLDGVDVDQDTLPMEARLQEALDFEKGCYVGQETIARATNLGGIKHILVGFRFTNDLLPEVGAKVYAADDQTGELTSVVRSPLFGPIGLGYVRTKHQEVGTEVVARWSESEVQGLVSALPFST